MRVFEDANSFSFANPNAIRSPGALIARPAGRLDVTTRLVAVIGLDGAIGGWTGLAEWRAPALAPPKDRDFALLLGPFVDTEVEDDFDWEAARALAELNTRLRPGDLLAGPPARAARGRRERPPRAHYRRRGHARSERLVGEGPRRSPGVSSGHAFLPASRRRSAQAPHPVPRQRHPAHRRGDGARGLHRERIDPLPPPVALPREGDRRVRADRARGVGTRDAPAPDDAHQGRRTGRRRGHRPPAPDVERGRRDLALPARPSRWTTSSGTARGTR